MSVRLAAASVPVERPRLGPIFPYALFLPAFVVVGLVTFVPALAALRQSLHGAEYLAMGAFVGLANYVRYFAELEGATLLWRSLLLVLGTLAVTLPLGIALAVVLSRRIRLRGLFRAVLILPWLVSSLLTGFLWAWLLDGHFGPLAPVLREFGVTMPNVVTSVPLAMPALVLANSWHSYPLVLVLAMSAIQTIPVDLIEAAKLDGAGEWQILTAITLPMIRGTILVAMVLVTLNTFNNATLVYAMTGGGPVDVTTTTALAVFLDGVKFFRIPVAAVGSVVCLAVNLAFAIAYMRLLGTSRDEEVA